MSIKSGILLCLVGPAGAGKTTFARYIVENFPEAAISISATSRQPRPDEVNGEDYHFMSREDFEARAERGEFFEFEEVHGNLYGTLKGTIDSALSKGESRIFDIDIRGAFSIKRARPDNTIIVFVIPPSREVLLERLKGRGPISAEELTRRMSRVAFEFSELRQDHHAGRSSGTGGLIEYIVVNRDLDETKELIATIYRSECNRARRLTEEVVKGLTAWGN